MNIFNDINKIHLEEQQRRAEAQKNAEKRHQEELKQLGIDEEQYQKIQKKAERKERIKDGVKGTLGCLGVVAIMAGAIFILTLDWVMYAIIIGITLILIGIVFLIIYNSMKWPTSKFWKIIISLIVSVLVVALVVWFVGKHTPEIDPDSSGIPLKYHY